MAHTGPSDALGRFLSEDIAVRLFVSVWDVRKLVRALRSSGKLEEMYLQARIRRRQVK